ncbi:MAG: hypothetical protein ACREVQ_05010 [Burkholderiales bacterium]
MLLTAALAALALWIVVDSHTRSDSIEMRPSAAPATTEKQRPATPVGGGRPPALPARPAPRVLAMDPFAPESWRPAAPAHKKSRTTTTPSAPPLPFRYVGRVYLGAGALLFVKQGDKLLSVKQGDALDGQYLVESVSGTAITFLHRPSGTRQTLRIDAPLENVRGARPAS